MNRPMNREIFTYKRIALVGLVLAMTLFVISMTGIGKVENTEAIAESAGTRISNRLEKLDEYIADALKTDPDHLMAPERIPDDMVV